MVQKCALAVRTFTATSDIHVEALTNHLARTANEVLNNGPKDKSVRERVGSNLELDERLGRPLSTFLMPHCENVIGRP